MTGLKARTIQNSVVRLRAHPSGALVERDNGRLVITPAGESWCQPTSCFHEARRSCTAIKTLPDGELKPLAMALDAHPKPISTSEIADAHALRHAHRPEPHRAVGIGVAIARAQLQ